MDINRVLLLGIVVTSIILVVLILLQQRGGGLGTLFGGSTMDSYRTRRGAEKFIYYATIASAVVWVGLLVTKMILG